MLGDGQAPKTFDAPAGCPLLALGGGRLLFGCGWPYNHEPVAPGPDTEQTLFVTDLAGKDAVTFRWPASVGSDGATPYFDGVGATWATARVDGYHYTTREYVNWHTEQTTSALTDADRTMVPDLDAAGLFVRLCAPIRRSPSMRGPSYAPPPLQSLDYAPPWALLPTGRHARLAHCGSTRVVATIPLRAAPDLAAGWLTWHDDPRPADRARPRRAVVHLLRLRDRRTYMARLRSPRAGGEIDVHHTASRLYVTVAASDGRQRLWASPLPS